MEKEKSKSLLWIIVLLIVFNVSTLSTIGYHLYESKRGEKKMQGQSPVNDNVGPRFNGRFFRDSLNLSSEQMDSFRPINRSFRSDANEINTKLSNLRHLMMQNMSSTRPDTLQLNSLSDSIGLLHARLKRDTYMYYLNIKRICNKEQQAKLNSIFETIFNTEGSTSCPNKEIRQGQRQRNGNGR